MQAVLAVLVGLMVSAPLVAEPLVEGWVRQSSGEPVEAAQVRIFDMTDLQRGAVAQATTDATGYFALPLAALTGSVLPTSFTLGQNYPNPFNPSTIIPYHVPTVAHVQLEVFNVLGQRVATLVDEERPAGVHTAVWDATDAAGRAVGAGVYFYRLSSAGKPTLTRRMVLVDGQAGQVAAASVPLPQAQTTAPAAERVYGLSVTGAGLVTYVDAAFGVRSGMAPVEVVVDAVAGLPRGKALTGGVLGDVNGDGQVTLDDALLVTTYVVNGSVELPANGDLALGDVNGDGQVTLEDAQLLTAYVTNPADPSLPAGIGQVVSSSGGDWVAGAIRRLTDDWADRFPSWSPDGQRIAFESRNEIYVMGSDGSGRRRLTDASGRDYAPTWSPDGRHIAFHSDRVDAGLGPDNIYVMGSDGSNLRRLTDNPFYDRSPSWSPDGRHIAFESDRDGNWDIYVMGSDGSNLRRLTRHAARDKSPSWSPDGRHIAFTSWRDGRRDGNGDIYVMGSDGSNLRRLTDDSAEDRSPSWSPDGRHIAFTSWHDGNWDIYVMGSDGSNPRNLTNNAALDKSPSWSPDGRHIAFESVDGIYVMELRQAAVSETPSDDGDSPATAITVAVDESIEGQLSAGDSDFFRVSVSSPGTLTASTTGSTDTYGYIEDSSGNVLHENDDAGEGFNFRVSAAVEPGTYYIRVHGFDDSTTGAYTLTVQMEESLDGSGGDWVGGAIRRLTDDSAQNFSPSWSPDGRHIAFVSDRDGAGNWDIYVMGSDGSNPRNLTNHAALDMSPSWSPDSRHIAFMSDRDPYWGSNWDIYVMGSDGSNPRNLTSSTIARRALFGLKNMWFSEAAVYPTWSPDGQHIAFANNERIYVMGSDGSNPRPLSRHSAEGYDYTWSPDGQHIAFVSDRDGNDDIYVMGSNGRNPRRLSDFSADDYDPTWSPDGRHIAFVSSRAANSKIYVIGSNGRNPRRLSDFLAGDRSPSWSPDGRHIAFHSNRDNNLDIYVMELRQAAVSEVPSEMKKDRIVEVLFGLNRGEADAKTNHDYNDYMASPHDDTGKCDGYRGGHSGWDVQTQSVAGDEKTANEEFYSLTSGQVVATGGAFGKIAVYNAMYDKTTLYLHARKIFVSQGWSVSVGTALGIQGNAGLGFSDPSKNEHVHIEVRDGESESPSCGAGATSPSININPIDYLYESIYESRIQLVSAISPCLGCPLVSWAKISCGV